MSRGLGQIERAILHLNLIGIEDTRAQDIAFWVHWRPGKRGYDGPTRGQYVSVLRAMHSLARKYPDKITLTGGKGRNPLRLRIEARGADNDRSRRRK